MSRRKTAFSVLIKKAQNLFCYSDHLNLYSFWHRQNEGIQVFYEGVDERISEMKFEVEVNWTPPYWIVETTSCTPKEGAQQVEPKLTCLSTSYTWLQG